jgi:hypothetical protein
MKQIIIGFRVMMFNATFNNISVISWHEIVIIPFNKTDCHDITEVLLKVAVNTITLSLNLAYLFEKGDNYLYVKILLTY